MSCKRINNYKNKYSCAYRLVASIVAKVFRAHRSVQIETGRVGVSIIDHLA